MAMKSFYVWLTVPSGVKITGIADNMLSRGFTIGPLGKTLALRYADKPADVISFCIQKLLKPATATTEEEKCSPGDIHDEVMNVIKLNKIKIYSIVVSESANCTWNTGNVSDQELELDEMKKSRSIN